MKKTLFLLLASTMLGSCASERPNSSDPIENLISYLESKNSDITNQETRYEGGSVLKTNKRFFCFTLKPKALEHEQRKLLTEEQLDNLREEAEIADSCLRAFRWGCSIAQKCYHKESHVLDKDTVVYALALNGMDGERIELEGLGSYEDYAIGYKAARAATLNVKANKRSSVVAVEYITREEKGRAEPFEMRPLNDFIERMVKEVDSVKVYETSYEITKEDWEGNPPLVGEILIDGGIFSGKTTGHLYVVPESAAEDVEKALRLCVENEYLRLHPNQDFVIVMREKGLFVGKKGIDTYFVNKTAQHQPLYAERSVDGHFYILVIDEVTGAFCIPRCWKHIIRIKDHKEYLIPGGHKPNKDGWID